MADSSFNLVDVESKPLRGYRKGSKYDPILNKFREGASNLSKVEDTGLEAHYLRSQLKKRIDLRGMG